MTVNTGAQRKNNNLLTYSTNSILHPFVVWFIEKREHRIKEYISLEEIIFSAPVIQRTNAVAKL